MRNASLKHVLTAVLAAGTLGLSSTVFATDCVQPNAEVVTGVTLRAQPTTSSAKLGVLAPGQSLPFVAVVPNWYEARGPSGASVFVSKRWVVVAECTQPVTPAEPPAGGASFSVDVFDVGTGLSVLVRGPDFALLYDAGSNDDFATGPKNRVVAYLKAATPAISKLDHVILSHPHKDHVELLPEVLAQFTPHDVWDSGSHGNMTCGYWNFLLAVAADAAIQYHTATQAGGAESVALKQADCPTATTRTATLSHAARIDTTSMPLGASAAMQFLYADGTSYTDDPNKNSLVLRLTLGARHVLLMGDAPGGARADPATAPDPQSIEAKLLQCCAQDLFADVMVVGHHGSKTSSRSAFISAVGASYYLISSGPKKYGTVTLPDDVVVQSLAARGTVLRTDTDDAACKQSAAKIGADSDGEPGGCNAIHVTIPAAGPIAAAYMHGAD